MEPTKQLHTDFREVAPFVSFAVTRPKAKHPKSGPIGWEPPTIPATHNVISAGSPFGEHRQVGVLNRQARRNLARIARQKGRR